MTDEVVILCGGRGVRLGALSEAVPKPLVRIGSKPILWHVMMLYAAQGFRRFILCAGYKHSRIARFIEEERWPHDLSVTCVDTGFDTPTGGRIKQIEMLLSGDSFGLAYADGLADIDLTALQHQHRERNAIATVALVRPQLPFGIAELTGDGRIKRFTEKPRSAEWVNGGFFFCSTDVFDWVTVDCVWERRPMQLLAEADHLHSYKHEGFWSCMDTAKDVGALNDLWLCQQAPWKCWELEH